MVKYNIISTGSDGNATILEEFVLIDCGVPYKALEPYVPKLKLVLLTHIHSDHFQKRTMGCRKSSTPRSADAFALSERQTTQTTSP